MVEQALNALGEHFDTVTIFTTRHEGGETHVLEEGVGNWFARYGQIKVWVREQESGMIGDTIELEEGDD
jgi:hypothetical protein